MPAWRRSIRMFSRNFSGMLLGLREPLALDRSLAGHGQLEHGAHRVVALRRDLHRRHSDERSRRGRRRHQGAPPLDVGARRLRELSEALRPAAEALADACAVSAGQEVLDVAAGDGNFAIACAREGASVVASDLSPGMVERGRARSERGGLRRRVGRGRRRGAAVRGRELRLRRLGVRRDDRPAAASRRRGAVPRRAPGRHGRDDGLDAEGLLRRPVQARAQLRAAAGRPAAADEWGVEDNVRERFDGLAARFELERARARRGGRLAGGAGRTMLGTSAPPWVAAKQTCRPSAGSSLMAGGARARRSAGPGDDRPIKLENEYPADRGSQARVTARRLLLEYDGSEFAGWARSRACAPCRRRSRTRSPPCCAARCG